ncbi:hypothetical protein [Conexibacter sp. DBS9H8]|uniref:hypothetical protein n=1 Tax=Conexibacter sp. DBS9H8 TaxID=2937801 RepID=UPI00200CD80C|nr:hypothetical protein [Conexibacter sp. DBS9H8]
MATLTDIHASSAGRRPARVRANVLRWEAAAGPQARELAEKEASLADGWRT